MSIASISFPCRRRPVRAALAAGLLALSGCAAGGPGGPLDGPVITYGQQVSPYAPSFVQTAARTGRIYVRIAGQPFPAEMPPEAIAHRIAMPGWLGRVQATTQPGEEVNTNFFVILAFNPAFRGPPTDADCAAPERLAVELPAPGSVRFAAGFCIGSRIGSYLVARQQGIAGPEDPRFANLLAVAMQVLLPFRDPNRDGRQFPFGIPF